MTSSLRRLADACEAQLQDGALSSDLRSLIDERATSAADETPSLAEGLALASSLRVSLAEPSVDPKSAAWRARAREVVDRAHGALSACFPRPTAQRVRGLYVIVDPEHTCGRDVVEMAELALRGGATAIQLRDKVHDKGQVLPTARRLTALCHEHGAAFIVNDHADLATACGAHGLHVGQRDLPAAEARAIVAPWQFIGRSNNTVEQALESLKQSADYIAVGSMFASPSKGTAIPAGVETLRRVRRAVPKDTLIVAIGGINLENVDQVVAAGADSACVISAVCMAKDPQEAARHLVERIKEVRRG
ncbi:MAG: thiamine phosphate synthase [Chloroflexi bacterium]|nr:thiamine phosphate synthase [Chloroflexota bacterium]